MIVMKFGGSSVGDAASIKEVVKIIARHQDRRPIVVVSAHYGITNLLEETATKSVRGDFSSAPIKQLHEKILQDLGLPKDFHAGFFAELDDLLHGISLVGELTHRSLDYVLSFGERMSARTLAACMRQQDLPAVALDAFDAGLITDSRFGRARPLPESFQHIRKIIEEQTVIPVITGYIAKDMRGEITTLGRNGSDYSAAIFGNAVDAQEIQIWTDVDGIMTADPRLVPGAKPIERMAFDEASELSFYGGRVLHPDAILPAMAKNIPVRVLNTRNAKAPGTTIVNEAVPNDSPIRAIVYKKNVSLITVSTARMLGQPGFMAKLFSVLDRDEIVIDMIATTEISVSMTTESRMHLQEAIRELNSFAQTQTELGSMLCIVGHGIKEAVDVHGRIFSVLAKAKIHIGMISYGALGVNIGLFLANDDLPKALGVLHAEFF